MSEWAIQPSESRTRTWDAPPATEQSRSRGAAAAHEVEAEQSGDKVEFSEDALRLSRGQGQDDEQAEAERTRGAADTDELTEDERRQIDKLESRDAEVRAHEAAHLAAGGSHVRGGANFSYQQGPDGKQYAVGGEVGIDVSSVPNNPQATIQKMQQVRAAALAPAEPSGADQSVAAKAAQVEARARQQLTEREMGRAASAYVGDSGQDTGAMVDATA